MLVDCFKRLLMHSTVLAGLDEAEETSLNQASAKELETLLSEIENACNAKLDYSALMLALSLPDVCGALLSPTGEASGQAYRKWYSENLEPTYKQLSADVCYKLRCGMFHQGRGKHKSLGYERVVFMPSNANDIGINNSVFNNALIIYIPDFCRDIVRAVRVWFQVNGSDPNLLQNAPHLLQFRNDGLPPYITGLPVIA